jgi:ABC-type phosphate transport system substrate-binding protein
MNRAQRLLACLIATLAMLVPTGVRAADLVVVIINKDIAPAVDKEYVAGIYTGRIKGWPDGSPVFPLDQGESSAARAEFYATVVGRSQTNMQALWAQNIFSGKGLPPKIVSQGAEMKRLVATNRNAIGYILASEVDDTVKVLRW